MLRVAGPDDAAALGRLMHEAIRSGPSPYTEAQRAAWSPAPRDGPEWQARLAAQHVLIADAASGPVGFMSLEDGRYIDFAYILPAARGTGLFRRLFGPIRAEAVRSGAARLSTHASLMAEPAFAAMGFAVVQRETVEIAGETLARAEMAMSLRAQARDSSAAPR